MGVIPDVIIQSLGKFIKHWPSNLNSSNIKVFDYLFYILYCLIQISDWVVWKIYLSDFSETSKCNFTWYDV